MNIRKIPIRIENEYVKGAGVVIGASASHDDVALKIHYGEMWEGLSKSIVWKDATKETAVSTLLTNAMIDEDGDYVVPVPHEPKAYPGEIFVSFKGFNVQDDVETAAVLTAVARFTVLESEWDEDAEESQAITPSAAEQLQSQIDNVYSKSESDERYFQQGTGKGLSTNDYDNAEKSNVALNTAARHTHGNKALLDTYTNSNADLSDAVSKKHSHSNKALLDSYTQSETNLADAVSKKHTHANKALLDSYDQTNSNIADAVNKKHTHSNKNALDTVPSGGVVSVLGNDNSTVPTSKAVAEAISQAGGGDMLKSSYDTTNTGNKVDTALNAEKLNGQSASYYGTQSEVSQNTSARHTHDNKALLDAYTQSESNLADAVSKKHVHSNKTVLDGISSEDVSNWDSKQAALTFDTVPTAGSSNPVTSGGLASSVVRGDIPQTAQTEEWKKQAQENIGIPEVVAPLNSHIGGLGNAIGMRGWNQIVPPNILPATQTVSGVTFTNNGDGTISTSGTASADIGFILFTHSTFPFNRNKPFIMTCCPKGGSLDTYCCGFSATPQFAEIGEGKYYTSYNYGFNYQIFIKDGTNVTGLTFAPNIFLLTPIFGEGNIPNTVEEFRAMFPASYYPYCSGGWADTLWTNALPSASFAPQDIALNLSPYRFVAIESRPFSNMAERHISVLEVGSGLTDSLAYLIVDTGQTGTSAINYAQRKVTVNLDSIHFFHGNMIYNGTMYAEWPDRMVPIKIYGIR